MQTKEKIEKKIKEYLAKNCHESSKNEDEELVFLGGFCKVSQEEQVMDGEGGKRFGLRLVAGFEDLEGTIIPKKMRKERLIFLEQIDPLASNIQLE